MKTYLPRTDGQWGVVFTGDLEPDGSPVLVALDSGSVTRSAPGQPSVYQVAHRRLHGAASDDR